MEHFKKKPLNFSRVVKSHEVRAYKLAETRKDIKHVRLSALRHIDPYVTENLDDSIKASTEIKEATKVISAKKPASRLEMLKKWKEEKEMKRKLQTQNSKPPFIAGGGKKLPSQMSAMSKIKVGSKLPSTSQYQPALSRSMMPPPRAIPKQVAAVKKTIPVKANSGIQPPSAAPQANKVVSARGIPQEKKATQRCIPSFSKPSNQAPKGDALFKKPLHRPPIGVSRAQAGNLINAKQASNKTGNVATINSKTSDTNSLNKHKIVPQFTSKKVTSANISNEASPKKVEVSKPRSSFAPLDFVFKAPENLAEYVLPDINTSAPEKWKSNGFGWTPLRFKKCAQILNSTFSENSIFKTEEPRTSKCDSSSDTDVPCKENEVSISENLTKPTKVSPDQQGDSNVGNPIASNCEAKEPEKTDFVGHLTTSSSESDQSFESGDKRDSSDTTDTSCERANNAFPDFANEEKEVCAEKDKDENNSNGAKVELEGAHEKTDLCQTFDAEKDITTEYAEFQSVSSIENFASPELPPASDRRYKKYRNSVFETIANLSKDSPVTADDFPFTPEVSVTPRRSRRLALRYRSDDFSNSVKETPDLAAPPKLQDSLDTSKSEIVVKLSSMIIDSAIKEKKTLENTKLNDVNDENEINLMSFSPVETQSRKSRSRRSVAVKGAENNLQPISELQEVNCNYKSRLSTLENSNRPVTRQQRKISLLGSPQVLVKGPRKSIKGDLISFSPIQ